MDAQKIIIGLEAHDGTGKTETSLELLKIFGGERYWVQKDLKEERAECYALKGNENFIEKCKLLDETYRSESELINDINGDFIVMDRTWASHAAERYYEATTLCNPALDPPYQDDNWPEGVTKPNITFQIILDPDEIRVARVIERAKESGEELSERDIKLNSDPYYRSVLTHARKKLGCKTFLIRERKPEVAALRIAQVMLGNMDCKPMKVELSHLI
ncbi:MAG: hypothetical protein QGI21_06825 [Candidatus Poseidoniaceae archaeon]|jgi:hypothetical protein|nr:hypothetical protein [Candidatus Poseidoniaceae archaeon]